LDESVEFTGSVSIGEKGEFEERFGADKERFKGLGDR
jgi:hypothetical protein